MADESEMIGGIKVSAEVTEAGLDQSLSRIEAKLKTAAERWQGMLNVHATATGPTTTGGAPGAPAAPLSSQVSFARGGGTGGKRGISGPDVANAYERAIAEALAAEQKTAQTVTQAISRRRETVVQSIQETAPPPIPIEVETAEAQRDIDTFAKNNATTAPIPVTIDLAGLREDLQAMTAEIKSWAQQASEAAVIHPQAQAAPAAGGGRGGRGGGKITQTFFDPDDDENKEQRQQAVEAQRREDAAARRLNAKESPASEAESRFMAALADANAPDAEEETGNQMGRLQFVDQLEKQRRDEARGKGEGPLDVNRVEASQWRQRQREEAQSQREADEQQRAQDRANEQRQLVEMSYENQQREQQREGMGTGFVDARRRTPQEIEQIRRDQDARANATAQPQPGEAIFRRTPVHEEYSAARARLLENRTDETEAAFEAAQQRLQEIEQADADLARTVRPTDIPQQTQRPPQQTAPPRYGGPRIEERQHMAAEQARAEAAAEAATEAARATTRGRGAQQTGGRVRETMEEFVERINERSAEAVQRTLSGITAGGRTGQVAASGISAARFGTRAQQVRATEEQRAGRAILGEAQRRLRIDPNDVEAGEALENAAARIAAADQKLANLQGFRATAKNLGAIAIGATLFSRAMSAFDPILQAGVSALGDWIDMQSGFVAKSTAVTSALATQTLAQKGNVDAVLAQASATAGLSAETNDYLATSIKTTTQIKAGALAQQQASDLFRAASGNQPQQGLAGGFGGLFGGSLFAQQLGGGKGIAEIIAGDVKALGGGGLNTSGLDKSIDKLDKVLTYVTDEGFREFVNKEGVAQGNPGPDIVSEGVGRGLAIAGQFNPLTVLPNLLTGNFDPIGTLQRGGAPPAEDKTQLGTGAQFNPQEGIETTDLEQLKIYIEDNNAAAARGKNVLGDLKTATIDFAKAGKAGEEELRLAKKAAIDANNSYALSLAQESKMVFRLNGEIADTSEELNMAITQIGVGRGIPDPDTLGRLSLAQERQRQIESRASVPALQEQFRFERPAVIAAANREQQFAQQVQLPAQAALGALANPLPEIGTGILAANADEQERIRDAAKETAAVQEELNSYYDKGKQILLDTYQIPPALLNSITQVGQQIANTQAGIRNDQAAYQVEQYNYQLKIARRTLADIGGLTGRNFGEGQSYLGVLEKQNLALSRQAQLLQFSMQQRQINFQVALAGFQAPGVTPEERQARVKEAEIEASFAQKQLNIQREMFGNQVQIVDIQNLRQGADLAAQIGLLLQGRQVTIDTALAEERIIRLQKLQQEQVAQAGTYIEKINKLTGRAFSEIQALETAAGNAMYNAATYAADAFNIYLSGVYSSLTQFAGSLGGQPNGGEDQEGWGPQHAQGYVGMTTGTTMTGVGVMGEAGQEAYAILKNPKPIMDFGGGGDGGNTYIIQFNNPVIREDHDMDKLAQKVMALTGREAALRGLRNVS